MPPRSIMVSLNHEIIHGMHGFVFKRNRFTLDLSRLKLKQQRPTIKWPKNYPISNSTFPRTILSITILMSLMLTLKLKQHYK